MPHRSDPEPPAAAGLSGWRRHGGVIASLLALASLAPAAELVAFLPTAANPGEIQKTLGGDPALSGWTITAATKHRVFLDALAKNPAVVVAPATFVLEGGWKPVLQGTKGGAVAAKWQLVVIDGKWTSDNLGKATVGLLQEVSREKADGLLAGAFPDLKTFPKSRLAAKPDDVFGMLGLEMAQVVVLSPDMLAAAKGQFKGTINTVAESVPIRYPIAFVPEAGSADSAKPLTTLKPESLAALGLDGFAAWGSSAADWRAPKGE